LPILTAIVICQTIGCNPVSESNQFQNNDTTVLNVNSQGDIGNSLDILSYVEAIFIPEDRENVLLSDVSIHRPYQEFNFILDDHNNILYCLDSNFNYLYKIMPRGKG